MKTYIVMKEEEILYAGGSKRAATEKFHTVNNAKGEIWEDGKALDRDWKPEKKRS